MIVWTIRVTDSFWQECQKRDFVVQDALLQTVQILAQLPVEHWRRPNVASLSGKRCRGLQELRFSAAKIQYRPIGFYGLGEMTFTIVLMTQKKGNKYRPSNFCKLAQDMKRSILEGEMQTREWEIEI